MTKPEPFSKALKSRMRKYIIAATVLTVFIFGCKRTKDTLAREVPREEMERIFQEIKTPFKYGIVVQHPDSTKMVDSPTIFRINDTWYMTYIVFDGQGYETWLSESDDLLHWKQKGNIFPLYR